jgi:hypothetical protein
MTSSRAAMNAPDAAGAPEALPSLPPYIPASRKGGSVTIACTHWNSFRQKPCAIGNVSGGQQLTNCSVIPVTRSTPEPSPWSNSFRTSSALSIGRYSQSNSLFLRLLEPFRALAALEPRAPVTTLPLSLIGAARSAGGAARTGARFKRTTPCQPPAFSVKVGDLMHPGSPNFSGGFWFQHSSHPGGVASA